MSKKIFLFISVSILSAAFLFSLNSVAIKAQNFSENQDKQYVPPVVSHKESESGLNFYLYPSEEYVQQMHEEGLSDEDISKIWDSAEPNDKTEQQLLSVETSEEMSEEELAQRTAHTPRATARLIEYLASTSNEQARLILEDPELLNTMLMDYYWEPYEEANPFELFAQKNKLEIKLTTSDPLKNQYTYQVSGVTAEKLSSMLRHQVIEKAPSYHEHNWMYFEVTDQNNDTKLFRYCQDCKKWQAFDNE